MVTSMVRPSEKLLAALDGFLEVDLQAGAHVGAALGEAAEAALASGAAAAGPAEHLAQDVAQVDALEALAAGPARPAAEAAAGRRTPGAALSAGKWAAGEAAHGLAPVGVDLSGVELLLLGRVAQDVEGARDLLEALLGRLVVRVGVGVIGLGELAERLADLVRARRAGDAQDLIGVARQ
jgi:hypothetical protein